MSLLDLQNIKAPQGKGGGDSDDHGSFLSCIICL